MTANTHNFWKKDAREKVLSLDWIESKQSYHRRGELGFTIAKGYVLLLIVWERRQFETRAQATFGIFIFLFSRNVSGRHTRHGIGQDRKGREANLNFVIVVFIFWCARTHMVRCRCHRRS